MTKGKVMWRPWIEDTGRLPFDVYLSIKAQKLGLDAGKLRHDAQKAYHNAWLRTNGEMVVGNREPMNAELDLVFGPEQRLLVCTIDEPAEESPAFVAGIVRD